MKRKLPNPLEKENRYLLFIGVLPAYLIFYILEERLLPSSYWATQLPADAFIPFCEYFVIPYVSWFPFLFATGIFLLLRDHEGFKKYMSFIGISFFLTCIFNLVIPTGQDLRPESFERSNICTAIMSLIYYLDDNQNVFPSMHVLGAAAATSALFNSPEVKSRAVKAGAVVLSLLICAATVLIKQHTLLDVVGALPLAGAVYIILYVIRK